MVKKKIFFISNKCWNFINFRKELIQNFSNNNLYDVYIISKKDQYVSEIEQMNIKFIHWSISANSINPFVEIKSIFHLLLIFYKYKPDIIFSFTAKANIYCSLIRKLKSFYFCPNITGLGSYYINNSLFKYIYFLFYKYFFKNSNFIFVQNKNDRNLFIEKYNFDKKKIILLPGSGINFKEFHPISNFNTKKKIFLMPARLLIEKGINEYYEAAKLAKKRNKNLFFYLVGDYNYENKNTISQLLFDKIKNATHIKYLGYKKNISQNIKIADCVVLPSYREGLSRSLLEALALGKPIITTDVPGCKELCSKKNGLICKPKSIHDLFDKIILFSELNIKDIKNMGKEGRTLVKKYDVIKVINKYNFVLKKLKI